MNPIVEISIHAPRMGSDVSISYVDADGAFQSTLPAWGATWCAFGNPTRNTDFNPRSPHGERHSKYNSAPGGYTISIHAPRMGSDRGCGERVWIHTNFNPRSSHGERRYELRRAGEEQRISIHAPRMGSDLRLPLHSRLNQNFNPRSPHGERRVWSYNWYTQDSFQSTLPAWGATATDDEVTAIVNISIHAPRMGSDSFIFELCIVTIYFNPRSPHGERHTKTRELHNIICISIHAPRMGSDHGVFILKSRL